MGHAPRTHQTQFKYIGGLARTAGHGAPAGRTGACVPSECSPTPQLKSSAGRSSPASLLLRPQPAAYAAMASAYSLAASAAAAAAACPRPEPRTGEHAGGRGVVRQLRAALARDKVVHCCAPLSMTRWPLK